MTSATTGSAYALESRGKNISIYFVKPEHLPCGSDYDRSLIGREFSSWGYRQ